MSGTKITLEDVKDDLNQILDRLSAIEIILNDPMHGIEFPEGVNVDIGEQPTMAAGIENFDGNYELTKYSLFPDNAGVDNITTVNVDSNSQLTFDYESQTMAGESWDDETSIPVSYTHLTLPTIYSV